MNVWYMCGITWLCLTLLDTLCIWLQCTYVTYMHNIRKTCMMHVFLILCIYVTLWHHIYVYIYVNICVTHMTYMKMSVFIYVIICDSYMTHICNLYDTCMSHICIHISKLMFCIYVTYKTHISSHISNI